MSDFQIAVALVLAHEGGLVDDPNDPGGLTNFGISQRWHPNVDIRNLTKEQAAEIYQNEYWKPYMAQEVNQQVANCALDCAVSQGPVLAESFYNSFGHDIRAYQLARLLRYAALAKPAYNHSWFMRTLDI